MDHDEQKDSERAGSFRIGDSVELMTMRQRHQELARKIRGGAVSEMERDEYLRLDDALHERARKADVEAGDDRQP